MASIVFLFILGSNKKTPKILIQLFFCSFEHNNDSFSRKIFSKYLKLNFDNLIKIFVLYLISIEGKENVGFFRSN